MKLTHTFATWLDESAGIVEEIGRGVTSVRPGDHVVIQVNAAVESPKSGAALRNVIMFNWWTV